MRFLMLILLLLCLGGVSSNGKCAKKVLDPIFVSINQEVNLLYFFLFVNNLESWATFETSTGVDNVSYSR